MTRALCIHGHFYQPPRENPWLEAVEVEDSARPYHDWNQRITAECYAPNAAARILDGEGRIRRIINNYSRISFDVGPTLLAWLEREAPEVYGAILAADHRSRQRFGGHGSALAQAYNHMILPLASHRDRRTQVRWGIRDFEHRFGRRPAGMWLPETAVDLATLDVLAEAGLAFTVLAPHQARRVRPLAGGAWTDFDTAGGGGDGGGSVDPRLAYRCRLPSGRSIDLFFYDGPASRAVAFEGLLAGGERFVERLLAGFGGGDGGDGGAAAQLVHIATDGETYGHHHLHGEMALAWALDRLEREGAGRGVVLTNYAQFLAAHPPADEVEIVENTSWSCAHGVERWRGDCGCEAGGRPGWDQRWRRPLRDALDWLRDTTAPLFEEATRPLLADPWAARDDYVDVVLDRSPASVERFFARHAIRPLAAADHTRALQLLELQRHAMLMYTSCGWFFSDLGGLEAVQVLRYAGRALQLAEHLFGGGLEASFLERLAAARSNLPERGDGREVFLHGVRPAAVDLPRLAAHYAVSSLFEDYPDSTRIYGYHADREDARSFRAGRARLAVGRVRVASEITGSAATLTYAVLHFGDQNLHGGVRPFAGEEAYGALLADAEVAFQRGDFAAVLRLLDRHFTGLTYSLQSLFRDEQRKVIDQILASTLDELEAEYRAIYERHAPLMRFLHDLDVPLPRGLRAAAELVLNRDLLRLVGNGSSGPGRDLDHGQVERLLADTASWALDLDADALGLALAKTIQHQAARLRETPDDLDLLATLDRTVALARSFPFAVSLREAQTSFYRLLKERHAAHAATAAGGDEAAARWLAAVGELGEKLRVRVG